MKIKDFVEMKNIMLAKKSLNNSCSNDQKNKVELITVNHQCR